MSFQLAKLAVRLGAQSPLYSTSFSALKTTLIPNRRLYPSPPFWFPRRLVGPLPNLMANPNADMQVNVASAAALDLGVIADPHNV
jgi:hypothetical protein